jgi:hypothetical protein
LSLEQAATLSATAPHPSHFAARLLTIKVLIVGFLARIEPNRWLLVQALCKHGASATEQLRHGTRLRRGWKVDRASPRGLVSRSRSDSDPRATATHGVMAGLIDISACADAVHEARVQVIVRGPVAGGFR